MWSHHISLNTLGQATSWKVDQFRPPPDTLAAAVQGALVPVGDLVVERKESVDPTQEPYRDLPYIGLDAVEPDTGELVNVSSALEQGMRSRAKAFTEGDILYGRLRAYLNKVALIGPRTPAGSCSGEFYVLIPDSFRVLPDYLRWALSTPDMVTYAARRLSGATHPRLSKEDLLAYQIALPSLDVQTKAVDIIRTAQERRATIKAELECIHATTSQKVWELLRRV